MYTFPLIKDYAMNNAEYLCIDCDDQLIYVNGPDCSDYDACMEFANFLGRNGFIVLRIRAMITL